MLNIIYRLLLLSFLGFTQTSQAICYQLIDPVGQIHRSRHPPYDVSYPKLNPVQQRQLQQRYGYLIISYNNTSCSTRHMNLIKIAKQIKEIQTSLDNN